MYPQYPTYRPTPTIITQRDESARAAGGFAIIAVLIVVVVLIVMTEIARQIMIASRRRTAKLRLDKPPRQLGALSPYCQRPPNQSTAP